MILVGALVLVLLASFIVSIIIVILELLAVIIGIILILGGVAAIVVGPRWWGRGPWNRSEPPTST